LSSDNALIEWFWNDNCITFSQVIKRNNHQFLIQKINNSFLETKLFG
jgi:hypothetical protein